MRRKPALFAFVFASALSGPGCATQTNGGMNKLTQQEQRDGWQMLFDGTSVNGWRNYKRQSVGTGWTVSNGVLTRSGENAGDIITAATYRNFDLILDWKVAPGGNSGIFYRATEDNDYIWQSAPEMQVLDDSLHADGKSPMTSAGSNFALYPSVKGIVHRAGEWNTARLLVNGNQVEHWLNGQKMLEYELGSVEWAARVAGSKFKSMPFYGKSSEGHIGLQDHGDLVEFRNIRIRVLP